MEKAGVLFVKKDIVLSMIGYLSYLIDEKAEEFLKENKDYIHLTVFDEINKRINSM